MGSSVAKLPEPMKAAFEKVMNCAHDVAAWCGRGAGVMVGGIAGVLNSPIPAMLGFVRGFLGEPTAPVPISDEAIKEKYEKMGIDIFRQAARDLETRMREEAKKKLGIDSVTCYNIAITGQTGAGKSTLINLLCGLSDEDKNAAKVGEVECTATIKKYVCLQQERLVLWDCPGAGTLNHPVETYFEDKMLFAFDFLIILFTER